MDTDIAVVGGGPAGLAAAVEAARTLRENGAPGGVAVLEGAPRVGRKLLLTGNGRCNLTNLGASAAHYRGAPSTFVQAVLDEFPVEKTLDFFRGLGVLTRTEGGGRVYPYSGQAGSVLDALRFALDALGVRELAGAPVSAVRAADGGFLIGLGGAEPVRARRVVLAPGGKAAPSLSGCPDGYALAGMLGHGVTPLFPALAPVPVRPEAVRALKGVRLWASVGLLADGRECQRKTGELQFGDAALSGICVFELSRLASEFFACGTVEGQKTGEITLSVDLMPEYGKEWVENLLAERRRDLGHLAVGDFLGGLFPKRVGQALLRPLYAGAMTDPASALPPETPAALARRVKDWRFTPVSLPSWQRAQVTAGGVPVRELTGSLQSRRTRGVFLAGELLDVDGGCGGYNLQWAWSSGRLAGRSVALSLLEDGGERSL